MAKEISKKELETTELLWLAKTKNCVIHGEYKNKLTKLEVSCLCGHRWFALPKTLIEGQWCNKCDGKAGTNLIKILETMKLEYTQGFEVDEDVKFDFALEHEDNYMVIMVDNMELLKDKLDSETKNQILNQNQAAIENGFQVLRIDMLTAKSSRVKDLIQSALNSSESLVVSDPKLYRWMIDATSDTKEPMAKVEMEDREPMPARGGAGAMPEVKEKEEEDEEEDNPTTKLPQFHMDVSHLIPITEVGAEKKVLSFMSKEVPCPPGKIAILGYCRVSTQMQASDGVSMEAQEAKIQQYAVYKGYHVKAFYYDFGISAKDTNRPGLKKLMDDIRARERLVVISLSRLIRSVRNAAEIEEYLSNRGAVLITLDFDIDTSKAIGKLIFNVINSISQFEREQTGERVSGALTHLSNIGKLRSRAPFGWKFVGKGIPFARVPEEQAIIEYIRKYKQENPTATVASIKRHLNQSKMIASTRTAIEWYDTSVKRVMLDNDIPIRTP
jgi:DNA invertase Pin-like site-specific DNA recombinase